MTRDGSRRTAALALIAAVMTLCGLGTVAQADAAPGLLTPPAVKGKTADGKRLKASSGRWTGKPSFSYEWERCDEAGANCESVAGSGPSFQTSDPDVGHRLRVTVTATNGEGSAAATSAPSAPIGAVAPRKKKAPAITGPLQEGQLLTAANGTWLGTGPISFTYHWEACSGSACTLIAGATHQTYRADSGDVGRKLRVIVSAANAAGGASATSKPSAVVGEGPPVDISAPSVAGLPVVEQTLSAEPGSWAGTGPLTYTYQWRSCNLVGVCEPISGANGPTYTVGPLQIANSIEVEVTARGPRGSASATSESTNLIKALLPHNLELPSIVGLLEDGGLLSAITGAWSGTGPLDFSYVWELCDAAGLNCKEVSGAIGGTLGLLASMIGDTVRVVVTATNSAGSTSATSEPSSLVAGLLPSNTELPSISGLLQDGSSLLAALGSWTGSGPLSFSKVWELCDATGQNCKAIEGAVGSTLALISSEIGDTVRLAVTASNSTGSTTAYSEPTSLVKALLPANAELPTIGGLLQDGSSLLATLGSWTGSGPLSFSKVWELCDASGQSCKAIEGAVGSSLALVTSEIGDTVRLAVTATNSGGSTTAYSEPTSAIKALLPSFSALPSIVGSLIDGSTLESLKGTWTGSAPTFSYRWLLCNATGASCNPIEGATTSHLGLITSMIGSTLRLAVTATNSAGSTTATSEPTSAIKALLASNTKLPAISGLAEDGQTLTGALGSWTGSEPSFSQQWELCNSKGEACKAIEKAFGSTLALLASEVGGTVRLAVTATNSAGSTTARSEPTSAILAILPKNTSLPAIGGLLQIGQTIEALTGGWSGSAPLTFSYQWQTCGLGLKESECTNLKGAVEKLLKLELAQVLGLTVRVLVTATNSRGSQTAASPITLKILGL